MNIFDKSYKQEIYNDLNEWISTYYPFGFHLLKIPDENTIQFFKTKLDGVACYIMTIRNNRIHIYDEGEDLVLFDQKVNDFKTIRLELEKLN